MLSDALAWISKQNPDQSYWYALGSNQQVKDKGKGTFVHKAKKASKKLSEADTDDDKHSVLEWMFGKRFAETSEDLSKAMADERCWARRYGYDPKEEFIGDRFPVDIRNSVSIDCEVTQNGFRAIRLRDMLRRRWPLLRLRSLDFFITETDVEEPFKVYWKVRNRGEIAFQKRMVRGGLLKDAGRKRRHESTSFIGPHYVECYLIKDGVCVAKDRIDVPIDSGS